MEWLELLRGAVAGILAFIAVPVLIYFLLINTSYLVMIVLAAVDFVAQRRRIPFAGREELMRSRTMPGISVVAPMHNEEVGIRVAVVRKRNSGRSDSINVGVNLAREDLVLFVDSDSILDPGALLAVSRPFIEDPISTVAAGGVIRAVNGCRVKGGRVLEVRMPGNPLADIQVMEYLRAFHLGRAGWSRINALLLISGAFGVFRRDALVTVGGLDASSIGEDFELVMRLHRTFRKQRRPYRDMLGSPRYGRLGLVAVPYYWLFELIAPLLELAGLVLIALGFALGLVTVQYFVLFMLVAYAYAMIVTLAAVTIEELSYHKYPRWRDLGITLWAVVLENLGYRQLTAWWRMEGWVASLLGRRQQWGTMTRSGFTEVDG
ncbi:glycosyltransferase [Glutamicibacter protophormiae]|nr:glycosyltransferase [Glutamicibacter protophormiae]